MTEASIDVHRDGPIATVVISRPAKLNAMTRDLWVRLGETVTELSADDSLRCLVLRGAGEKAFSPGNDIGEFATERSNVEQGRVYGALISGCIEQLFNCRHPMVAMIHGICVGGGLEIAATCDIRVCGTSSRFGAPIKNLGLVMAHAELGTLIKTVGPGVARELLLEGRIVGAEEAKAMGLVNRIVADGEVEAEAYATARRIAEGAPLVARWHKKFIARAMNAAPLTEAERNEAFDCFGTADFQAGYTAFLAKKPPVFEGR